MTGSSLAIRVYPHDVGTQSAQRPQSTVCPAPLKPSRSGKSEAFAAGLMANGIGSMVDGRVAWPSISDSHEAISHDAAGLRTPSPSGRMFQTDAAADGRCD